MLDEGPEKALDLLAEAAGVNMLMLNSHTYYGAANGWRKPGALAQDHGVAIKEHPDGAVAGAWIRHNPSRFKGLPGHRVPPEMDTSRDVYRELLDLAHQRGMKVYARYIEGWETIRMDHIEGWRGLCTVDVYGKPHHIPCFANPNFQARWEATVRDILEYPVNGIFHGFERGDPLSDVLWYDQVPYCFCEYCQARGKQHNIDIERTETGYKKLHKAACLTPNQRPFMAIFDLFLDYPEILQWARLEQRGKEKIARMTAKLTHEAGREFGTFLAGGPLVKANWEDDTAVPDVCDFSVQRIYADVSGTRLARDARKRQQQGFLSEFSESAQLEWSAIISGNKALKGMDIETLDKKGMPVEFATVHMKDWIEKVNGCHPVYAGIGVDIPGNEGTKRPSNPEYTYEIVRRCLKAGAKGLILCREYEEISAATMKVIKKAVNDSAITDIS